MRLFLFPTVISLVALGIVWWWGGIPALLLATALAVLEITLSFDNAVVNAKILSEMSAVWQKRFLTWGILVSVFGTRLVLPILIVSAVAFMSPIAITLLAIGNPEEYSRLLISADTAIKAFGGAFLIMVSLKYFFDAGKEIHWIGIVERRLAKWGRVEAIEITLALLALFAISLFSHGDPATLLRSGIIGIALFTLTQGVAQALGSGVENIARGGMVMFIYLNVLDSAFSLDGVIGAFALTSALPIIVVGLGIGAYFVRTLTVQLVRAKTLDSLVYLEHGAHWAIFGLALCMFAGLIVHVPEILIATVGLGFILFSYISSRRVGREKIS